MYSQAKLGDPASNMSPLKVSIGTAVESTHAVVGFDQPGIDSNSSNASAVKALFIVYPGVDTSGERD